jgi:hypothetical protein
MPTEYKEDPKLQGMLHPPKEFVGSLDPRNGSRAAGEKLLRTNDKYLDFLALFGKFGCNATNFRNYFEKKRFQEIVTNSMEAFLVTVYTNNYDHWNQEDEEGGMRQVKMSGRKRKHDCSGWTDAGVALYNSISKEIRVQRKGPETGGRFDERLQKMMTETCKQPENSGRKRAAAQPLDGMQDFSNWVGATTGEEVPELPSVEV